jgi:hypothetical protein
MTLEDALEFYRSVVARVGSFPIDWEVPIVRLSLEREPGRPDLLERLRIIQSALSKKNPGSGGATYPAISTDVVAVSPFET